MRLVKKNNSTFSRAYRFLWARTVNHQVIVNTPLADNGNYQRILLSLTHGQGKYVGIDLTNLTLPELLAFREAIAIATEIAEPIVRELDRAAQEKVNDGSGDFDERVYRALPTVVVRRRALGQYDQGILDRRSDVLAGIQAQLVDGGPSAESGSNVAE